MTLKLYGYPASHSVRIVAMTLTEKKVPFELITVGMEVGEHKSPAFLEKQPFGQVPVIVLTVPLSFTRISNSGPPIVGR